MMDFTQDERNMMIKVGRYKRATKESFEKWYHNQTRYQLAEDRQERS